MNGGPREKIPSGLRGKGGTLATPGVGTLSVFTAMQCCFFFSFSSSFRFRHFRIHFYSSSVISISRSESSDSSDSSEAIDSSEHSLLDLKDNLERVGTSWNRMAVDL